MPYVLITGASGGIGGRCAVLASSRGWEPLCVGRSLSRLQERLSGYRAHEADVCEAAQVRALFEQLDSEDTVPTALIHAVGSTLIGPLDRVTPEQYAETLRVNLTSAFLTLASFVALLKKRGQPGSAVLFSSVVSRIGVANHEVIAAAKAGVEGLALSAAASYAALGIRVNVVAPGLTETPLTQRMLSSEAGRTAAVRQYPLTGINQAEDVAATAQWLISPEASRITGQVIAVDGGFSRVRPLVR